MKPGRLARLLAERLEERGEPAAGTITVGQLLEEYVPYELARGSLGLAAKSEYDLLVLEFLADERLTVQEEASGEEPSLRDAAAEELETPEPGLAPLEERADAALRLDLATLSGGYRGSRAEGAGGGEAAPGTSSADAGEPDEPDASSAEVSTPPDETAAADRSGPEPGWDPTGGVEARPPSGPDEPGGETEPSEPSDPGPASGDGSGEPDESECRSCGRDLPLEAEVSVRFCPYCGASRPERACPECDAELEPEWTYCPACGTQAAPFGGGGAA